MEPSVCAGKVILYWPPTTLPHTCHVVKVFATSSLWDVLPEEDDVCILANEKTKACTVTPLLRWLLSAAGGLQATVIDSHSCLHSVRLSACPNCTYVVNLVSNKLVYSLRGNVRSNLIFKNACTIQYVVAI